MTASLPALPAVPRLPAATYLAPGNELYLRTASGRRFRIDAPTPADVHWPDVAAQLAKTCRFAGATTTFYSVAQHSVLVADIIATRYRHDVRAPVYGLLHDAHEMVLGDIPAPTRTRLHQAIGWKLLDAYAQDVDEAVTRAAGLPWPVPDGIAHSIHSADMIARHAEARQLLAEPARGVPPWPDLVDLKPWPRPIKPMAWDKAEDVFLARLRDLAGLAGLPIRV